MTRNLARNDSHITASGDHSRDFGDRLFERSGGNPLFLSELLQMLSQQQEQGYGDANADSVPKGVRDLIGRRASHLSSECRRALSLASVAGMQWSFELVRAAAAAFDPPMNEDGLIEALDEALGSRILEELEVGGSWGYAFRHPLIQASLYESLSRRRRLHLHGLLGRTVEQP